MRAGDFLLLGTFTIPETRSVQKSETWKDDSVMVT